MKRRVGTTKRCRECGAKCTHLDDNGICYECVFVAKRNLEKGKKPQECSFAHPALKKTKD
jgi:hypothetical protein